MTAVVDASVVVSALVDSGPAGRWSEQWLRTGAVAAPHHMPVEAANILRRAALRGDIPGAAASAAHGDLLNLPVELYPYELVAARSWELRANLTLYDAPYVALAELLGVQLVTLDERLARELFETMGVETITPENYAIVERLSHWQAALNMVRSNPWLGVGPGNFDAVYEQYRLLNWDISLGHAHNYYLNVMAETGIMGLAAYGLILISLLWTTWRTRRHPDVVARCLSIGLLGTWVYLSTHSLTDNLYVNNIFIHIGIMIGLLAVLDRELSGRLRAIAR